ncbi:MAG: pyruvate dehydrogenase [Bdellovibrionaceae bacterium]|nr:pyruvate dehydrogenase [Pseudobdellovibrionaceae bacterium]MDW8189535.1 pyruvate dehydrogenase [Pseudobdellovibrionaceae bacterium]
MLQATLNRIARRALYLSTRMIYEANHRTDKEKGDPKIGGHAAASSSVLHILGSLHLVVRTGFDFIANKPHAAPMDHAYHYLLGLLLKPDLTPLGDQECDLAMMGLRKYSHHGEPVFQSYHSPYDSDHFNFLPSGTVGIPPVNIGYLALAYRYAREHGWRVPDQAHFWAICGDSEFREGSIFEAVPEFAEREIGNLTWILDYNRQSLDGHRITNHRIMGGSDADRIEKTFLANGWEVVHLRHGSFRKKLFEREGGNAFRQFLEKDLLDYELQVLLQVQDMEALRKGLLSHHRQLKKFLDQVTDEELKLAIADLGGHDFQVLVETLQSSRRKKNKPSLIIAHTIKGYGLECAAAPGNHNSLPEFEEVERLRRQENIPDGVLFSRFNQDSEEGRYLKERGQLLLAQFREQQKLKEENQAFFHNMFVQQNGFPSQIGVNLKMASYPHTQWMLGQLNAKLNRCANTPLETDQLPDGYRPLSEDERRWKKAAELMVAMAPDVGTSTNLNPLMDGKIFGVPVVKDWEKAFNVKDSKTPDLVPGEDPSDRFIRFEIAEANSMSCLGSFGKMRDFLGIPILPVMTVYDFFIKRALDQFFYDLYWKSSFILVGTPSGITLSPEGAQHGWKSDFQIPNQITWEPFFCQELDWILSDAIRRHMMHDNQGRSGVLIRCVTRGVEQKDFLRYLQTQRRFKKNSQIVLHPKGFPLSGAQDESQIEPLPEDEIWETIRADVLSGAYYLIDYRGYQNYQPGDNVVHIFAMGSPSTEAIKASKKLLEYGIYANVIIVTSPDLVCGNLAYQNDYEVLRVRLGISGDLYVKELVQDAVTILSGLRVPIVSVHDGEPGLLDNIGAIVGVKQIALSVRKHSKCGRPAEIYHYHGIDWEAIVAACLRVLEDTARENIRVIGGTSSNIPLHL